MALRRDVPLILLACYGLTLAIHWAHRDDWLSPRTLALAVPGALIVFALAAVAPAALFCALRFRLRHPRLLAMLWLAAALGLTLAAATARI